MKEIKERIKPVIEKYQIEEVYLLGSYARGEANRNSDVDIYCSSGIQSNRVVYELINKGFKVVNIFGGYHNYLLRK